MRLITTLAGPNIPDASGGTPGCRVAGTAEIQSSFIFLGAALPN